MNNPTKDQPCIALLGANFSTGNLGVSALAWSSIHLIRTKWPDAKVNLVGGRQKELAKVRMVDGMQCFPILPVRYCANILVPNHIIKIILTVVLCRLIPLFRTKFAKNDSTTGILLRADLFFDITGGDSFSDIYGFGRFFRAYLLKRCCQVTGKNFILLPQTYGPFKTSYVRFLARSVLRHSEIVYSRDNESIEAVKELLHDSSKIKLCPDVAFLLKAYRPTDSFIEDIEKIEQFGLGTTG